MPTTTYQDPAFSVNAIQARTNAAGTAVVDVNGRELRLSARAYTPGVIGADSYKTTAAGGSMVVSVGSGTAFADLAVVGATAALGNYWILLEPASQNFTVPAAHLTLPRIDQIYLIVEDGSLKVVRLGYRQGDAAASPSAPGPDSSWEGSLLLSSIAVGAGASTINQGNVTDARGLAQPVNPLAITGGFLSSRMESRAGISNANLALSTTFENVFSSTFTKPSDWVNYEIAAMASVYVKVASGTGSAPEARIRINGGTIGTEVGTGLGVDEATLNPVARFTGLTGSATVEVQARHTGGAGQTKRTTSLFYIAFRTG